jgi:quercetin dioxygenase-like cupin family protein
MRGFLKFATVALAAMLTNASTQAQAPAVLPGMKILLENDCVRVRYHDFAVGQSVPMHSHPAYVGYALEPFKALVTLPDGTQKVTVHKAGEAYWSPPVTHAVRNIGSGPIHNLLVEIKPGGKCQ